MTTPRPVLLRADNFTSAARTPWGGTRLASHYKRAVLAPDAADLVVGESWELSVGPEYPVVLESGESLQHYIQSAPEAILGHEYRLQRTSTALMVKLIDTREPLSLQIHPHDSYAGLSADECGKPESWYVVDRAPGAGLYLGFHAGVGEREVRETLARGESLAALLRFVEVEPGDFFLIEAGTPHAIGAGLTLVEPQHVLPGRRGVTYRYWDWDRRYDAHGNTCAGGTPRPLHLEHALAVTDWARVTPDDFVSQVRLRAGRADLTAAAQVRVLAGPGGLASPWLRVARVAGTGLAQLPFGDRLSCVTVLEGEAELDELRIAQGRSAVVPACWGERPLRLGQALVVVSAIA